MSDIQLYLLEADKARPETRRVAAESASKLENRKLKLVDLVTSLEPYINNHDDKAIQSRSVAYLADVLEIVSSRTLTGQERRLLCDFILGRIEGGAEGVGASARALVALEQRGKWDTDTAQRIMRTFLDHTNPLRQFKLQTERYPIIQLVDVLFAKYRPAIKHLHEDDPRFMDTFVAYFEGEKDPRNLMVIFSLLRVPMVEWDIHATAHDMFEAVFNYFPITFKPPPDDPYGITAQDLKDRLKDCIAANSDFAPYALPALLDKLDSTSLNTKRDVLQVLQACAVSYELNTLNLYSVTLWDALKFEIINVQEEDLAQEALKALTLIAKKFVGAEGPLYSYLRPIVKECNEHLEDAPTKQSQGAGRILYSVSTAGTLVAEKVVQGMLPVLFSLYQSSESIAKRRGLLEVLNQITKAHVDTGVGIDSEEGLKAFADNALDVMVQALARAPKAEVSFRLTALTGLSQLVGIRGLLSEGQTSRVIDAVIDIVLHERIEGRGDISSESIKTMVEMAHTVPEAVRQQAIPAFMVELPDAPEQCSSYQAVLEAFTQLSSEQQVFDTVVLRIKNKWNAARYQGAPKQYQRGLLLAILYAFTHGSPMREGGVLRDVYFSEYAEPLINHLKEALPSQRDSQSTEIIGRIVNVLLRQQSPHFQSATYRRHLPWLSATGNGEPPANEREWEFAPFSLYFYAAIRPEVAEASDIVSLLRAQVNYLLHPAREHSITAVVLRHLSLLINKFAEHRAMQAMLHDAGIEVESLLSQDPRKHQPGIAFAVVKALVVQGRCGQLTVKYLQVLMARLTHEDVSYARQFAAILAPDDILTKENHCTVSGLHKQKFFSQTVPSMIGSVRSADPTAKPNYLIALSGVLRWLPYSIIESSLESLVPPLLQSLDLSGSADQDVKYTSLSIFESLLMHDASTASEHSASLVTRLLNSTSSPENNSKVRAKALQCLTLVPRQLKREAVIPYRRPVVKKLLSCLDDGKRMVRAEAVKCRSGWLALDESTEDDE